MADTAPADAPQQPETIKIALAFPIKRSGGDVAELVIRKPKAGELRGLKVEDLFNTDVNTLITVLPRITMPALIAREIEDLEADDLLQVAGAVKGFFMPQALKEAVQEQFGG